MNTRQQAKRIQMLSQNNVPTVNPGQPQNTLGSQQQNMNTQKTQNAQVQLPSQTLNVAPAPNQTPANQLIRERQVIWHGVLEWIEKRKCDQPKRTSHVPCQISAISKDEKPEVNSESWPPKLIMQFVPKILLGHVGVHHLRDSKSVVFHPQNCEARVESLSKFMSSGFAGCVHFKSTVLVCDIKVLMLLYTSEKNAFLGFIPNNQAAFVDRLREIILRHKRSQVNPRGLYLGAPQQQMLGQNSALLSQLSTTPHAMGAPVAPVLNNQQQVTRIQILSQNNYPSFNPWQPQNTLSSQQQNINIHNAQIQRRVQTLNVAPVPNQAPTNQPIFRRQIIWQGPLEWMEKANNNQPNPIRHVLCKVSTVFKDGEPKLNAKFWPQKLVMQLMPKLTMENVGVQYLKDSKYVLFHPQNCESLEFFTKVMSLGHAGCVHFTSRAPLCDVRVLILVYIPQNKMYLGFVPKNQAAFIDRLREVIQKLKQSQLTLLRQYMGGPGQTPNVASAPNQAHIIQSIRERHIIWHGVLDWIAKGTADQPKQFRHIPCQISVISYDGKPKLNAAFWPQKLVMQVLPKQIMGLIGGQYLRDCKSVFFHPLNCEALESLTKVMSLGYAGCVHFLSTVALCDIKVLILLYSSDKKAYLGFIPMNQAAFVDRLRKVIQEQKELLVTVRGQAANAPGGTA